MSHSENDLKQCFWCGTFGDSNNHVSISEDVPPRWLSGEKKVKKLNCVPQCNECKNALALLDDSVVGYFKYGAKIDLEIFLAVSLTIYSFSCILLQEKEY